MRKDDTAFRKASHVMMRLSHEGSLVPPGTSLCAVGETKQGIRRHIKLYKLSTNIFRIILRQEFWGIRRPQPNPFDTSLCAVVGEMVTKQKEDCTHIKDR